jgi:hypothetical protein
MTNLTIGTWLDKKFREWENARGRKSTITAFAKYLEIPSGLLNKYMNDRNKPEGKNVEKLASKLGNEIYDLLGLARPDTIPLDRLPHQVRDRLANAVYEVNSELVRLVYPVIPSEAKIW